MAYGLDPKVLDYLMEKRRPTVDPNNQLMASLADATAAMGTLGGKRADTSSVRRMADAQDQRAMASAQDIQNKRRMLAQEMQRIRDKNTQRDQLLSDRATQREQMQEDLASQRKFAAKEKQDARDASMADWKSKQEFLAQSQPTKDLNAEFKLWKKKEDYKSEKDLENKKYDTQQKKEMLSSKGMEAVDKDFAKTYTDFIQGGKENSAMAINMLDGYVKQLEDQKDDLIQKGSGKFVSYLPDFMRSDEALKMRDDIAGIAMQGLKDVFVGAISNAEREALAATFYNDKLSPNENLKILNRKLSLMKDLYENKLRASEYFEANGTLQGFDGMSKSDAVAMLKEKDPQVDEIEKESGVAYASDAKPKVEDDLSPTRKAPEEFEPGDRAIRPDGKIMIMRDDRKWYFEGE